MTDERPRDRRTVAIVLIVTVAALTLRLCALDAESLWFDELSQVANYSLPLTQVVSQAAAHGQPPLDYLIGAGLHRIGLADSDWWVRFPAAVFGAGSVFLLGICVTRMASGAAGVAAAVLLTVCPLHVVMSQEARPYTIFYSFALAAVLAYAAARRRDDLFGWIRFGVVVLALLMTRWVGPHFVILGLVVHAIVAAWVSRRGTSPSDLRLDGRRLQTTLATVVAAYALYGPVFGVILYRSRGAIGFGDAGWAGRVVSQLVEAVRAVFFGYSTDTLFRGLPGPTWLIAFGATAAIVGLGALLFGALRRRSGPGGEFLCAIVPFPILYTSVYVLLTPITGKPQYLLLITAPLLAGIAIAADAGYRRLRSRGAVLSAIVFAFTIVIVAVPMARASFDLVRSPNKRDWRGVMTHLRDHARRRDAFAVVSSDAVPAQFAPAVGGQMRYERRGLRFLRIDLDTDPSVLQESPWTRPDATVWIVGFNDRMYLGTDQLPTPVSRDPQTRVHRFHGLFLVEMHGGAPAAQRLADGIALIADHLPDGRAVTAPLLFRGRYLLAQGDRTAAAACFEAARRQCRSEVEANTLLERFVPREARSLLVAVSHPRSEPSERRSMLKERAEVSE